MKTTKKYQLVNNEYVEKFTIKEIFSDNWKDFTDWASKSGKVIRPVIHEEVQKIINCQSPHKGYAQYMCPKCNHIKHVPFTCKSRFCNTCGAKYSSDRALNMSSKLLKGEHRHVVFTIAEELRSYFAHDRKLIHLLFQAAADTIFFILTGLINQRTLRLGSSALYTLLDVT